jgi:sec-independent protein translocase protein TatC
MSKKRPNEMSFLEHIEALRKHIVRAVLAILFFSIVAFSFKNIIFDDILFAPKTPKFITNELMCKLGKTFHAESLCINQRPFDIINIKMAGQFMTHVTISLIVGLVVAFPFIFNEFWRFLKPALKKKEKKHSRGAVVAASLLFSSGAMFGYFIIVPLSIEFFGGYNVSQDVRNQINLDSYIQTFTSVVLASGVVFELPILIYFLSKIGLVTPKLLKKYRKHAIVVILIIAAVITPPDIFSQILVSLPLVILYELGIGISRRIERKSLKLAAQEVIMTDEISGIKSSKLY